MELDSELLLIAYRMAREATQLVRNLDDASFVETQATVYKILASRRALGQPIDDEYLKFVTEVLRDGEKRLIA